MEQQNTLKQQNDQTTSMRSSNSWPRPYLENRLEKLQHHGWQLKVTKKIVSLQINAT
jgi:hypothetical protein